MRILCFDDSGVPRFGVRSGERIHVHPDAASPFELTDLTDPTSGDSDRTGWEERSIAGLTLLPPVPRPGKIVCIGLNYRQHAAEGGNAIPDYPAVFLRSTTSLLAPGAAMLRPACSDKLDYEAELAVVIGVRAARVPVAAALGHVAGYACFNDGSVRDYQRKSSQWTIGKNFDATGAFGPELVTADEVPAGARGLRIVSRVNGTVMQDSNTDDMIRSEERNARLRALAGHDAGTRRRDRDRHTGRRRLRPQSAPVPASRRPLRSRDRGDRRPVERRGRRRS